MNEFIVFLEFTVSAYFGTWYFFEHGPLKVRFHLLVCTRMFK